jgi:hypothetical protein
MFKPPFESLYIKIKSLIKFVFRPSWRRTYFVARYVHDGLTTQEAMVRVKIIES